jgi:peptidoglycan lytic transglycosylase G
MRSGFAALAGIALVGGALAVWYFGNAPVDVKNAAPVEVTIPSGAGGRDIARMLRDAGLIRSPAGFVLRNIFFSRGKPLQAGRYVFTRAESGRTIFERLQKGDALPTDIAVTIPEGFTLKKIAARFAQAGVVDEHAFLEAARVERFRSAFPFLQGAPDGSLEGYLFPDTYRFFRGTNPEDVIRKMLARFGEQFGAVSAEAGGAGKRSVHEIVTLASIIEGEVRTMEDRKVVSGILWSRLDHHVALAADATVRYALDTWDRPLTIQDLAVDSPYNTRKYAGLPPGPIGNPGADSLRAALRPQDSEYFYYLSSAKDRKTIFSKTLEEHNAAIREHLR